MQTRIEGISNNEERSRLMRDIARLAETAEHLLELERSNQTEARMEIVDLVEIARTAVADIAPIAIAAGYEISFECDAQKVERRGNLSDLGRAVSNLIHNAIDHGGNRGSILVSVAADRTILVLDDGPGIAVEHLELIFEPFYRVTPRSTGAGLGLSLVKQIVKNHGGQVVVHTRPNGTTFGLSL